MGMDILAPPHGAYSEPGLVMLFVLTGPESTAKSVLTAALSRHFEALAVRETARVFLADMEAYGPSDLLAIAQLQLEAEASAHAQAQGAHIFADTDLQVLHIWWQERFGPAPESLSMSYARQGARHYLLCEPDIPWTPDPLRENPHDRERLFELYEADLKKRQLPYSRIAGAGDARLDCARAAVEAVLRTTSESNRQAR